MAEAFFDEKSDSKEVIKPLLFTAIENDEVSLDTLNWLIDSKKQTINCEWNGEHISTLIAKKGSFAKFKKISTKIDGDKTFYEKVNLVTAIQAANAKKVKFLLSKPINNDQLFAIDEELKNNDKTLARVQIKKFFLEPKFRFGTAIARLKNKDVKGGGEILKEFLNDFENLFKLISSHDHLYNSEVKLHLAQFIFQQFETMTEKIDANLLIKTYMDFFKNEMSSIHLTFKNDFTMLHLAAINSLPDIVEKLIQIDPLPVFPLLKKQAELNLEEEVLRILKDHNKILLGLQVDEKYIPIKDSKNDLSSELSSVDFYNMLAGTDLTINKSKLENYFQAKIHTFLLKVLSMDSSGVQYFLNTIKYEASLLFIYLKSIVSCLHINEQAFLVENVISHLMNLNLQEKDYLAFFDLYSPEAFKNVINYFRLEEKENETLLHFAAKRNFPELVAKLLKLGADIKLERNHRWPYAIQTASYSKYWKVVHAFAENCKSHKDKGLSSALHDVYYGTNDESLVYKLLQAGADPFEYYLGQYILNDTLIKNDIKLASEIIKFKDNKSEQDGRCPAIITAVEDDRVTVETLSWLLDQKQIDVNVKYKNETPISIAWKKGKIEKLKVMASKKDLYIDLSYVNGMTTFPDFNKELHATGRWIQTSFVSYNYQYDFDSLILKYKEAQDIMSILLPISAFIQESIVFGKLLLRNFYPIIIEKNDSKLSVELLRLFKPVLNNLATDTRIFDVYNKSLLHIAAENDFVESVEILINHGANITVKNNSGLTPIVCAAIQEKWQTVIKIATLKKDVDGYADYGCALIFAINKGQLDVVNVLLEADARLTWRDRNTKEDSFVGTLKYNNIPLLSKFLDKGYNCSYPNKPPIIAAAENKEVDEKTFSWLLEQRKLANDVNVKFENKTALELVIRSGNIAKIKKLFAQPELDFLSEMKLLESSELIPNKKEILKIINSHEIQTRLIKLLIKKKEIEKAMYLTEKLIVLIGPLALFTEVLSHSDIEIQKRMITHWIQNCGDILARDNLKQLISLIIAKPYLIYVSSRNGNNPLHLAARANLEEEVDILIKLGADLTKHNLNDESPLVCAAAAGSWKIVSRLSNGVDNKDSKAIVKGNSSVPNDWVKLDRLQKFIKNGNKLSLFSWFKPSIKINAAIQLGLLVNTQNYGNADLEKLADKEPSLKSDDLVGLFKAFYK